MVFQDVAMQQPIAGVVGDEQRLDLFVRFQQDRISPDFPFRPDAVPGFDLKDVTMQVHGVRPGGIIGKPHSLGLAPAEREHR